MTQCHRPAGHRTGSTDTYAEGCRCPDSLAAHEFRLAKNRRRYRQINQGTYTPDSSVDPEPVRAHLRRLLRRGHLVTGIAAATGVAPRTVLSVLYDGRESCRNSTAEALLAFKGDPVAAVYSDNVPALATQRRLRALAAIGHTVPAVAALAPVPAGQDPAGWAKARASTLNRIRHGDHTGTSPTIEADTAAAYDALWNQPPDRSSRGQRAAVTALMRRAASEGWLPPMYLDDDRMADPSYRPRIPYNARHDEKDLLCQ